MRRNMVAGGFLVMVAVLAVAVTGCKHPPKNSHAGGAGDLGTIGTIPNSNVDSDALSSRGGFGGNFKAGEFEPVYFDFDSAKVRPSELPKLETVAKQLKSKKVIVEGHADERGTAEYNRALGERRALACREELTRLGVSSANIQTSSLGEERPTDAGHDDAAWAKNRRCEFLTAQ